MILTERAGMKMDSSQEGIALLLVLWVLTILMVVVLAFSYMTKTETLATSSFKGITERKFLAEAGIERGIMEIFFRNAYKGKPVLIEGGDVWSADGTLYSDQIGDGSYTVRITDERGKLDINHAPDTEMTLVLKNLLVNLGVEDEQADTIVDSILDWRDPDDLQRLHGAETPYYMSLPAPYKAKDGPFDTVEELILVKGMTREILYGGTGKKGLIDFVTVNGSQGGININAAPKELLMAMPDITSEIADHIIEIRQTKEITNLKQEFPDIPQTTLALMSAGGVSNTYTIEATGKKGDESGGYTIRATVTIEGNTFKYVYYKSPATPHQ
jgi:general secretion pathway protein K